MVIFMVTTDQFNRVAEVGTRDFQTINVIQTIICYTYIIIHYKHIIRSHYNKIGHFDGNKIQLS